MAHANVSVYCIVDLPTGGTAIKRIRPNARILHAGYGASRTSNQERIVRLGWPTNSTEEGAPTYARIDVWDDCQLVSRGMVGSR
jgi:hypothetical protein